MSDSIYGDKLEGAKILIKNTRGGYDYVDIMSKTNETTYSGQVGWGSSSFVIGSQVLIHIDEGEIKISDGSNLIDQPYTIDYVRKSTCFAAF